MGVRRTPTEILEARGAFVHNPDRGRERLAGIKGELLGSAPDWFDAAQHRVWDEFVSLYPHGVLTELDRVLLETAVCLTAEFREKKGKLSGEKSNRLIRVLSLLGMAPTERSKVRAPEQPKPKSRLQAAVDGQ